MISLNFFGNLKSGFCMGKTVKLATQGTYSGHTFSSPILGDNNPCFSHSVYFIFLHMF